MFSWFQQLFVLLLLGMLVAVEASPQDIRADQAIEDIIEEFVLSDEADEVMVEEMADKLSSYADNPLDINKATKEELEELPFLSPVQVENILYYVYISGGLKSLNELRLVESLDLSTIRLLSMFVTVLTTKDTSGVDALSRKIPRLRYEVVSRAGCDLTRRRGYERVSDSVRTSNPGSYYLGNRTYYSIGFSAKAGDKLQFGVRAEKDYGEEFFRRSNKKGFDYYSAHLFVRDVGKLKTLAVGDYKVSFGKGLVVSNDYYMGRSIYSASMTNKRGGIRRHFSNDENNFFRGIASTFRFGRMDASVFYSFRKLDAHVDNLFVTSLKTDGYHRLKREIDARNCISNNLIGSNLNYDGKFFNIGLTFVYTHFDKMLKPEMRPYNAHYPQGKNFLALGLSYNVRVKNIFIGGETAVDGKGEIAAIHSVDFYPASGYRLFLVHRYYAEAYSAVYARSLAAGGQTRNETGFYGGAEIVLPWSLKLTAACDSYRFPWLRYAADKPSVGIDWVSRLTYSLSENLTIYLDFRHRSDERNETADDGFRNMLRRHTNKVRLHVGFSQDKRFSLNTYVDYVAGHVEKSVSSRGFALTQVAACQTRTVPLRFAAVYSLFDTDDYASRIYVPAKNLPYTFSFPSVYGKGMYCALTGRYDFRNLSLLARYSLVVFDGIEFIGDGSARVDGNKRSDFNVMLIAKF